AESSQKQGYFALLTGSSAAEKRTKQLIIRVSPTEFETLTRQKTHPNLARYIRERVLEDGKASDKKTVKFQFPPEVVRVLAGMGNNLNQIAKALNTAAKVGTLGNVEALKATTELAALERSLNSLRDFLAKEKNGWQSQ
ncbi:UNVERIFIED_CONTAM: MobC family plasmid mobilization relaxosome protein, partial [Neisseria gonorrhoeae]